MLLPDSFVRVYSFFNGEWTARRAVCSTAREEAGRYLSSCWVWEWAWSEILRYQVSWNKLFYTVCGILIFALTDNLPYCWNIVIYDSHLYHDFIAISLILPHTFHSLCGIKCHIWDIACPNNGGWLRDNILILKSPY